MKASCFLLILSAATLGCEGSPHGPIEGAGRGATPPPADQAVEQTLRSLDKVLDPIPESGDNNSPKSAMTLTPRQPVHGTLLPKEKDWFVFESAAPAVLRGEVAQVTGCDVRLSLYGEGGKRLLRRVNNQGKDLDEVISNFQVEGTHHLLVERTRAKRKKGKTKEPCSYTVLMVENPPTTEDEREPNGSRSKASSLAQETIVRGYLNNGEDKDYFRVAPPASHVEALAVQFLGAPGSPAELVFFYGEEGRGTRSFVPAGERVELLPLRVSRDEKLFIAVKSLGGFNVNTPYRLEVIPASTDPNAPTTEPNDSTVDSNEIQEDAPGWISWPGDKDFWRVSNAKRGVLRVEFSGVPGVTLQASLIDENQKAVAVVRGNPGDSVLLPNVMAGSRPMFLAVEGLNGTFNARIPYRIQTQWREGVGEEREPNNQQAIAARGPGISLSQTTEGYLGWADDVDWLHLDLRAEEMGGIKTLKVQAPPSVTIQVRWVDETGQELLPPEIIAAGAVTTLTTFVMPGSYGIELKGLAGGFSAIESYSVSVQP